MNLSTVDPGIVLVNIFEIKPYSSIKSMKHMIFWGYVVAFIFCVTLAFIYSTTVTCAELNLTAEKNETPNQWKRVE